MSAYVGIQPSLRTATKADIPLLLTVRGQTMSEYLLASGVEPTEEDQIQRVLARFDCAQIILLANQPIGLLKIVRDGKQWELVQIQIVPEKQGGGIGTQLVQKLLSDAVATKASVSLSVLKANPARRLYERLGFRIVKDKGHAYEMHFRDNHPLAR